MTRYYAYNVYHYIVSFFPSLYHACVLGQSRKLQPNCERIVQVSYRCFKKKIPWIFIYTRGYVKIWDYLLSEYPMRLA